MRFRSRKGKNRRFIPLTRKRLNNKRIYTNKNHNVMIKKLYYEAPDAELLEVKFEENFCGSDDGTQTPVDGGDEDF